MRCVVVKEPEEIVIDGIKYARVVVKTARGERKMSERGEMELVLDTPDLMTSTRKMMKEIMGLHQYDVLYVNGVINTKGGISKPELCTECGAVNNITRTTTYVNPVFIEKTGEVTDDESMVAYLEKVRHVSNEVNVMGRLTRAPKRVMPKVGLTVTQYQIGLLRHVFIPTESETRVDYPWIKAYGEDGDYDWLSLDEGSIVFIDGYLQTRHLQRTSVCTSCGKRFTWKEKIKEIVPFETEYISGYRSPEEVEELREKRLHQSLADKFGTINRERPEEIPLQ